MGMEVLEEWNGVQGARVVVQHALVPDIGLALHDLILWFGGLYGVERSKLRGVGGAARAPL